MFEVDRLVRYIKLVQTKYIPYLVKKIAKRFISSVRECFRWNKLVL